MILEDRLPLLILSITNRCNLDCDYCFNQYKDKSLVDLPLEDWKTAYNMYKPIIIQLAGGEPTLRWNDILEFLDYVCKDAKSVKYPAKIHIATNGTTDINFETIPKEYRKHNSYHFLLDGFEEFNDKYRGKGSYKKTHDAIIRCLNAGISASINCTMSSQDFIDNIDSISEFIEYFFNIGIKFIRLNAISYSNFEDMKAISILKNLEVVKNHNVEVVDKSKPCKRIGVHINSNRQLSPRCIAFKHMCGDFSKFDLNDVININNYCINYNLNCKSSSYKNLDRFISGLLAKKG